MERRDPRSAARRRLESLIERLAQLPSDARCGAVRPSREDATQFSVRLGKMLLGPIHAEDVAEVGLRVGEPLDAACRARLADALAREAARAEAVGLLRTRSRSKRDLLSRLALKGHERAHAAAAVERLARAGLVDDEGLAQTRAETLALAARMSPRGAEVKLRALGIDAGVSRQAVAAAYAGVDLLAQATDAAIRRAAAMGGLDQETLRRRLFGYLARRGYDHETCRRAIEQAIGREGED